MPTKVAVIGAGGMLQYHAGGFQEAGAQIVALADMNETAAQAAAKEWKIPNVYTDIETMLSETCLLYTSPSPRDS